MPDITHQDLLAVQQAITTSFEKNLDRVETGVHRRLDKVDEKLDAQTERGDRHEADIAVLKERTKLTSRGLLSALTPKQKAALWTGLAGASGLVLDGLRHLWAFIVAFAKTGVHP